MADSKRSQSRWARPGDKYPAPKHTIDSYDWRTQHFDAAKFPIIFGLDGQVSQTSDGLIIDSNRYQVPTDSGATVGPPPNPGNDHVHWLRLSAPGGLPLTDDKDEEVAAEVTLSAHCLLDQEALSAWVSENKLSARITDPQSDIRLACAAFNLVDLSSFLVFDFLVSNSVVYALYERLPFAQKGFYQVNPNDPAGFPIQLDTPTRYAAFSYAIPVYKRDTETILDERLRLRISLNTRRQTVSWFLNDRLVYQIKNPGRRLPDNRWICLDHGGEDEHVPLNSSRQFSFGFGTFYILDFLRPAAFPKRDKCGQEIPSTLSNGNDADPEPGKSERVRSGLAQIDYNENYQQAPPLGPVDCDRFGINGGCSAAPISSPFSSEAPAQVVPFSKRYFPERPQGTWLRVENARTSRGGRRSIPRHRKNCCCCCCESH